MDQLGKNLQERLMAATLYKDAAQLSELHLQDYEGAVEAYNLGNLWEESLLVASLYQPDLKGMSSNCSMLLSRSITYSKC